MSQHDRSNTTLSTQSQPSTMQQLGTNDWYLKIHNPEWFDTAVVVSPDRKAVIHGAVQGEPFHAKFNFVVNCGGGNHESGSREQHQEVILIGSQCKGPIKIKWLSVPPGGELQVQVSIPAEAARTNAPSGYSASLVAGTGVAGFSGDGAPATGARFDGAAGLAIANDGTLYVADEHNNRLRRISPSGIIATFAGTGAAGSGGDGGPADSAQLNTPSAVAVGANGSVYVTEFSGNRIREISRGVIRTIAGPSDLLKSAMGMALGNAGNIFVAATGSQRVFRINSTLALMPLAGTGQASFGSFGIDGIRASVRMVSRSIKMDAFILPNSIASGLSIRRESLQLLRAAKSKVSRATVDLPAAPGFRMYLL
jgi:hypothetical protein